MIKFLFLIFLSAHFLHAIDGEDEIEEKTCIARVPKQSIPTMEEVGACSKVVNKVRAGDPCSIEKKDAANAGIFAWKMSGIIGWVIQEATDYFYGKDLSLGKSHKKKEADK